MSLPAAIEKQDEEVQALYKQMNDAPDASKDEVDPPADAGADDSPDADPDVDPDAPEDFEQKYRTLQGMFDKSNSDLSRSLAANEEQAGRLANVENLLASLSAQKQQPAQQPEAPAPLVTDQDREAFDPDTIDLMRRVSLETQQKQAAKYEQEMAQLRGTVQQLQSVVPDVQRIDAQQQNSSSNAFWQQLHEAVPDWEKVNVDPGFVNWLDETDPMSGMARRTFLTDAHNRFDAARVINFFLTWKELQGNTGQSTKPAQKALQDSIAPGRGRTSGSTKAGAEPSYTREQVSKFYEDMKTGKYRGREEEAAKTERDITQALAKGRIT